MFGRTAKPWGACEYKLDWKVMLFALRMVSALDFAVALKLASSAVRVSFCSRGLDRRGRLTACGDTQRPGNGSNLRLQEIARMRDKAYIQPCCVPLQPPPYVLASKTITDTTDFFDAEVVPRVLDCAVDDGFDGGLGVQSAPLG